ncbi:universal stress protein [Cyanobium sp. ATX 6A2]|jgi:nucleotide-binding universal stress UspA family protein|uniref:universal stress protein n=1 Tax=Cyanobium sp. ATX 6A2 TaxID=2823700 RepID=UPI0020CF7AA9|nr:universal stress protein [Cyanobium sp. ATX 6A2]MCP9886379.1 universal stress protein [Cyanobium sp. ATX 6A2]
MTFQLLLVPTDGSEISARAVHQAVDLAAALGARVRFLHVQNNYPISLVGVGELVEASTIEALVEAAGKRAEAILQEAVAVADKAGVLAERAVLMNPLPHKAILEEASATGADLIVMGSHGRRGLEGLLLGSETQRVLLGSSTPVLVVR